MFYRLSVVSAAGVLVEVCGETVDVVVAVGVLVLAGLVLGQPLELVVVVAEALARRRRQQRLSPPLRKSF